MVFVRVNAFGRSDRSSSSNSEGCDSLFALLDDYCDDACASIASLSAADLLALDSLLGGGNASDEHEASSSSSSSPSPSPSTERRTRKSKAASAKIDGDKEPAPRSWDPNRARKKQREEIERLRVRAEELHAQLGELQAERVADTATTNRQAATGDAVAPSTWRRAAIRERNARARAEAANAHMKLVLENQRRIAESLETLLRASTSTKEILGALRRHERSDSYDSASEAPDNSDDAPADVLAGGGKSHAPVCAVPKANGLVPGSKRPRLWLALRPCSDRWRPPARVSTAFYRLASASWW